MGKHKRRTAGGAASVKVPRTPLGVPAWAQPLLPTSTRSIDDAVAASPMSLYGTNVADTLCSAGHPGVCEVLRHAARTMTASSLEALLSELHERLEWDIAIASASGRWHLGEPDPELFVPGDITALRAFMLGQRLDDAIWVQNGDPVAAFGVACIVKAFYDAQSYFVPADCVDALFEADPPAEELDELLVLAAPMTAVWFGKEVPFSSDDCALDDEVTRHLEAVRKRAEPLQVGPFASEELLIEEAAIERDGRIVGMVLFSDDEGHLEEEVLWIVSAGPNPAAPPPADKDRVRGEVFGYLSCSTFGGLARVAAATVAWGGWEPPTERLVMPSDPRARRRVVQTSAFRRKEPHGAVAGVRVLDVARTVPTAVAGSEEVGRAALERLSPVPHWRKPHVRRYRIGPRHAWHYEERKIGRSRVMPTGPVRSGDVVWRIPRPEGARRRRSA